MNVIAPEGRFVQRVDVSSRAAPGCRRGYVERRARLGVRVPPRRRPCNAGGRAGSRVEPDGYLAIRFQEAKEATDVQIIVEASGSVLGPWTTVASVPTVVSENSLTRVVKIRDTVPIASAPSRFMRRRVQLAVQPDIAMPAPMPLPMEAVISDRELPLPRD